MSSQIDHLLDESRQFPPSPEFVAQSIDDPALYQRASTDREGFWAEQARELLHWHTPFENVLDWSNPPFVKWFDDGELNVMSKPATAIVWHCSGRASLATPAGSRTPS